MPKRPNKPYNSPKGFRTTPHTKPMAKKPRKTADQMARHPRTLRKRSRMSS